MADIEKITGEVLGEIWIELSFPENYHPEINGFSATNPIPSIFINETKGKRRNQIGAIFIESDLSVSLWGFNQFKDQIKIKATVKTVLNKL